MCISCLFSCVWKFKEEKTCEQYQSMVKDKVAEAESKYFDVNEHWQRMKNIMMDAAQVTCGMSKGPCRHKKHGDGFIPHMSFPS